jgi:hypothetical protein
MDSPMRRTGKPTNLYLNPRLKAEALEAARERYNCSLSELVERLLAREVSLKRGMLSLRAR